MEGMNLFRVNYKNKWTLSALGRRGFLTSLVQRVQVLLKPTIKVRSKYPLPAKQLHLLVVKMAFRLLGWTDTPRFW